MRRHLITALTAVTASLLIVPAPAHAAAAKDAVVTTKPAPQQVLSPTPYQGWNTYFGLGGNFSEESVREVADSIVSRGLAKAGYDIVWLDGGWQDPEPRTAAGDLQADRTRFPNGLKPLVDYIHSKGLKAGIYTDAGPYIPGKCGLGSGGGYYQRDANHFAALEFDAVKVDFLCGIAADLDPKTAYTEFAQALRNNASKRPIIFNLCNPVTSPDWGNYPEEQQSTYSWTYAPQIAQSWRTYTDVGFVGDIKFKDVLRNYDANARHPEVAGPGHFNDPDYLAPGLGMSEEEFRTQMTLWSAAAAPLVIGSDIRKLSQASIDTLTDPEVLAINQDPAGVQAVRVGPAGTTETWVKRLANGDRAVVLLNRGESSKIITTKASSVGLSGARFTVKNAWTNQVTESAGTLSAAVPAHGAALLRVAPARGLPGTPHVTAGLPQVTKVGNSATPEGTAPVVGGGDQARVEVVVRNDGLLPVLKPQVGLAAPAGWTVRALSGAPIVLAPGRSTTFAFTVTLPATAAPGDAALTATTSYEVLGRGTSRQTSVSTVVVAPAPPAGDVVLSHHTWISATSGWMTPTVDQSVGGGSPISMIGQVYPTGLGVASPSTVRYYVGDKCDRLTATVGLDDAVRNVGPEGATSTFQVVGDGRVLFDSGVLTRDDIRQVDVDLTGVRVLDLLVGDGGDGGYNDRANWAGLNASC
ncbi:NPCBM/NEW2 domain-containing protein [Micromonospora parathelypteridis]|uniref:Alpha-galactosidase n=1 Tax=Micromonospora parathelypteridis TaxID=1839617 RepID=A0A840VW27_9ACTN|nr:NPCBM/NEW2 domain-containing protein [Micromonospora parathelypteridis]MBB5480827.1 alpha-galactosidase [Micromonospora parathelypteridis]GGO21428.1 alpha-galactosidase [Micromonospora parathelypteridis]